MSLSVGGQFSVVGGAGAGAIGLAIGSAAVAAGGVVVVGGAVIAAAAAVGGTILLGSAAATYKTLELTARLSAVAVSAIASDLESSYSHINERNKLLIENEINIKENFLKIYRESIEKDENKSNDLYIKILDNINFAVLPIDKEAILEKNKNLSWKKKFDYLDGVLHFSYQHESLTNLIEKSYEIEGFDNALLTEIENQLSVIDENQNFLNQESLHEATNQLKELFDNLTYKLDEFELSTRDEYVSKQLRKLKFLIQSKYVSPLLYLLNDELVNFSKDETILTSEMKAESHLIESLSEINELAKSINDLPTNSEYDAIQDLITAAFKHYDNKNSSSVSRLNFVNQRKKILNESYLKLQSENHDLYAIKSNFETLLYKNNMLRANLGYKVNQYRFNVENHLMITNLITEENEILSKELEEMLKAKEVQAKFREVLEEMGYEYLSSTSQKTPITRMEKSLYHAGKGNVVEIISTGEGKLYSYVHGVEILGMNTNMNELKTTSEVFCSKVDEMYEKLKESGIDYTQNFRYEPEIENLKTKDLQEYSNVTQLKAKLKQKKSKTVRQENNTRVRTLD
jgi:hypothetical protein